MFHLMLNRSITDRKATSLSTFRWPGATENRFVLTRLGPLVLGAALFSLALATDAYAVSTLDQSKHGAAA